jgi:Tfp pilus assembly protein PilX
MNRWMGLRVHEVRNERGAVLVTGLLFVLVLTILGIGAMRLRPRN